VHDPSLASLLTHRTRLGEAFLHGTLKGCMLRTRKLGIDGQHGLGFFARQFDQTDIGAKIRETKLGRAALARAQQIASAAAAQILLGDAKSILKGGHDTQTIENVGVVRQGQKIALRLLRAPPDPAAQLVKLGQAEALGVLDDHDPRPRQIHADLDHRRRHQDIERPSRKASRVSR
jgi:hypothetical protein